MTKWPRRRPEQSNWENLPLRCCCGVSRRIYFKKSKIARLAPQKYFVLKIQKYKKYIRIAPPTASPPKPPAAKPNWERYISMPPFHCIVWPYGPIGALQEARRQWTSSRRGATIQTSHISYGWCSTSIRILEYITPLAISYSNSNSKSGLKTRL